MLQVNCRRLDRAHPAMVPGMVARRRGRVNAVRFDRQPSSQGPRMAVLLATKAYVLSLVEGAPYELRATGVTVTTLVPRATA